MPATLCQKGLSLTQEEALALLEMCTLTLASESPTHLHILSRLGDLCREMLNPAPCSEKAAGEDYPPYALCSQPHDWLTIASLY